MNIARPTLDQIAAALEPHGLVSRGGFNFDAENEGPEGGAAKSVVLVGHFSSSIWPHFEEWRLNQAAMSDPLDSWSKAVLNHVAAQFGASAVFPSDKPYLPFQEWARRAEGLQASPLGLLIHPEYGLWQAYRGALLFGHSVGFPQRDAPEHPCDSCEARPCLAACPVNAFDGRDFAVDRCRSFLATGEGEICTDGGCLARLACPVGRRHAYLPDQQRFHMAAFAKG